MNEIIQTNQTAYDLAAALCVDVRASFDDADNDNSGLDTISRVSSRTSPRPASFRKMKVHAMEGLVGGEDAQEKAMIQSAIRLILITKMQELRNTCGGDAPNLMRVPSGPTLSPQKPYASLTASALLDEVLYICIFHYISAYGNLIYFTLLT